MNTRRTALLAAPAAAALTLMLAACGAGTDATADPAVTTTQAVATPSATPEKADPVTANWDAIVQFVRDVHVGDLNAAQNMAAEDSPARHYTDYLHDSKIASQAAGAPANDTKFAFSADAETHVVTINATPTEGDAIEYAWKDFQVTDDGKITGWTGASGALADVLGKDHDSKEAKGQKVTVAHAYKSNDGGVNIILKVESTVDGYPDSAPVYVGPDGVARKPSGWVTNDIVKDATTYLQYFYPDADFGGKVKYEIDYDQAIDLQIS